MDAALKALQKIAGEGMNRDRGDEKSRKKSKKKGKGKGMGKMSITIISTADEGDDLGPYFKSGGMYE